MGVDHLDVKVWRLAHGLTQAQLARLLEVQVYTVSAWERRERAGVPRKYTGKLIELALKELDRQLAAGEVRP